MWHRITVIMIAVLALSTSAANSARVASPDGKIVSDFTLENGKLFFSVRSGDVPVLEKSSLAMALTDGRTLGEGVKKMKTARNSGVIRKKSALYVKSDVAKPFNSLTLKMDGYELEVLAMDGGLGLRWVTHMPDSIVVRDEMNRFVLPGDCFVWETPVNTTEKELAEQVAVSFEDSYYRKRVSELDPNLLIQSPMLVELSGGKRLLISDYNTQDYPGMFLLPDDGNALKSYFARYPLKEYQGAHLMRQVLVGERADYMARVAGSRAFPWKMLLVVDSDAELMNTHVPFCLADDNKLGDVSWVRPGKVAWEWWSDCNVKGVDFKVGVNTATYKYWIDFAAERGIEYVIMDEGWSVMMKNDLRLVVPEIDLPAIVDYGRQKGVGIILWAGHYAFARDMEGIVDHFADMGVAGFKIDFINRNDQLAYRFIEKAARTCAKRKMVIDFHGIFAPVGFTYTFPNVLNFEGVMGLECAKWKPLDIYDHVRHDCILPFTRNVVGPMDYTQGAMNNATKANYRPRFNDPMSQGTRCRQLGEYVTFISPLSMLCDSPDQYRANGECADYIAQIPTVWDETRVLGGEIGQWVAEARRKGDVWYLGGVTNWDERDVELDVSWLAGKKMRLFTDGVNADRNAEDYRVEEGVMPSVLRIHMAPGGGFAARVE